MTTEKTSEQTFFVVSLQANTPVELAKLVNDWFSKDHAVEILSVNYAAVQYFACFIHYQKKKPGNA